MRLCYGFRLASSGHTSFVKFEVVVFVIIVYWFLALFILFVICHTEVKFFDDRLQLCDGMVFNHDPPRCVYCLVMLLKLHKFVTCALFLSYSIESYEFFMFINLLCYNNN